MNRLSRTIARENINSVRSFFSVSIMSSRGGHVLQSAANAGESPADFNLRRRAAREDTAGVRKKFRK